MRGRQGAFSSFCSSWRLHGMDMAGANARCREMALQLFDQLCPYLSEWKTMFCRSIVRWRDERILSVKQLHTLFYIRRSAARRALTAEHRARRFLAGAMPANTLPV
jgi:hypothetical protein